MVKRAGRVRLRFCRMPAEAILSKAGDSQERVVQISDRPSAARPTTLIVCVNRRSGDQPSCAARGGVEQADQLESAIRERRLQVKVERVHCLGVCTRGPNMRLAPGGAFFFGVSAADIPAVVERIEAALGCSPEADSGGSEPSSRS